MAIGFSAASPLFRALMFGVTDIDAVLDSSLPNMEMFYQITQSRGIAAFIMCWVILIITVSRLIRQANPRQEKLLVALTSQWVTAGQMARAFARDVSRESFLRTTEYC